MPNYITNAVDNIRKRKRQVNTIPDDQDEMEKSAQAQIKQMKNKGTVVPKTLKTKAM
jgi:hypothetical protein